MSLHLALEEYEKHRAALSEAMVWATTVVGAQEHVADLERRTEAAVEQEVRAGREVARLRLIGR